MTKKRSDKEAKKRSDKEAKKRSDKEDCDVFSEVGASEEGYRNLVEFSPDPVIVNKNHRIAYLNSSAVRLLGAKSAGDLIGSHITQIVATDSREAVEQRIDLVLRGRDLQPVEEVFRRMDGSVVHVEVTAGKVIWGGGPAIQVQVRDISKRKEMRRSQEEFEARYRKIFETSPDGIAMMSSSGDIKEVNQAFLDMTGFIRKDVIKRSYETFFGPSTRAEAKQKLADLLETGKTQEFEGEFLRRSGRSFPVLTQHWQVESPLDGEPMIMARVNDITKRKRAEERLWNSERRFKELAAITPIGVFQTDAEGSLWYVNDRWSEITGMTFDQATRKGWSRGVHPEDRDRVLQEWKEFVAAPEPRLWEYRIVRPDRTEAWVMVRAVAQRAKSGEVLGFAGVLLDISERKASEAILARTQKDLEDKVRERTDELRLTNARLLEEIAERTRTEESLQQVTAEQNLILDNVQLGVVYGKGGRIFRANRFFAEMLGYTVEECEGMSPDKIYLSREAFLKVQVAAFDVMARGDSFRTQAVMRRKDGSTFPARLIAKAVDPSNPVEGAIWLQEDMTEEKRLMEQREHSQKMAAIGTLASGIAHDFNNLLAVIAGNSELIGRTLPPASKNFDRLQDVLIASERARELIAHILTFSRRDDVEAEAVDTVACVQETLNLLRASLPSSITLETRINPDCPNVMATPNLLHQILINLGTNARDAMDDGKGVLNVVLEPRELNAESSSRYSDLEPGDYVSLRVSDTGHGIPAKIKERIFEPFFTTKAVGEGTGLGLSMVHGIVSKLGGAISVQSEPGAGARFEVLLPRTDEPIPAPPHDVWKEKAGSQERILLIDDETPMLRMLTGMLEDLNYAVTGYVDPIKALAVKDQKFDLVITDQTMPGMTGLDVARQLKQSNISTPVILMTGYLDDQVSLDARALGIEHILTKPVRMSTLSRTLEKAIRG